MTLKLILVTVGLKVEWLCSSTGQNVGFLNLRYQFESGPDY